MPLGPSHRANFEKIFQVHVELLGYTITPTRCYFGKTINLSFMYLSASFIVLN